MQVNDYKILTEVGTIIIFCISLPLTLVAIYALYRQVRKDHVAPIYVINLLISDIIQLCCWTTLLTRFQDYMMPMIAGTFCFSAVVVSVGFRVCIALERYLVIAHPLWNCLRRSINISVVVCVLVWVLPLAILLPVLFLVYFQVTRFILGVFFLLPLPLFIFFLGGTLKALSASVSVPSDEKRWTVGLTILLLLSYMLLFLPSVLVLMAGGEIFNYTFVKLSFMLIQLCPLADSILYFFMREGDTDGNKQQKKKDNKNNRCDQLL